MPVQFINKKKKEKKQRDEISDFSGFRIKLKRGLFFTLKRSCLEI